MRTGFADDLRKVLLGIGKLLNKLFITLRFFERIEIDPLYVFDNGELEGFLGAPAVLAPRWLSASASRTDRPRSTISRATPAGSSAVIRVRA